MRIITATLLLAGALAVSPVVALAQSNSSASAKPKATTGTHVTATHAARGVVKSMDANQLVISRSGKKNSEMTFSLNNSTQRSGTIAVGSPVSVRYQKQGTADIATAITAEQTAQKATHSNSAHKS